MIKTFKIFEGKDIDPYDEEDWDDKDICSGCLVKVNDKLLDRIYGKKFSNKMKISDRALKLLGNIYVVKRILHLEYSEDVVFIDSFVIPLECVDKVK